MTSLQALLSLIVIAQGANSAPATPPPAELAPAAEIAASEDAPVHSANGGVAPQVREASATPVPAPPAAVVTTPAPPGWPLDVGASFFTRYEMRQGYDRLGVSAGRFLEGDWVVYRARLNLATAPIPLGPNLAARVYVSPQADGWWGSRPSTVSAPNLGLYEGYARLQHAAWHLDVGHFRMNYGDALIIGDMDWNQTGRSFDGARLHVAPPGAGYWVDAFLTQLAEGSRLPDGTRGYDKDSTAGDAYFGGIYGSVGELVSPETTIEPYLFGQLWGDTHFDDGTRAGSALQSTAGVRALQKLGIFDVRLEPGVQFGHRRVQHGRQSVLAYQADLELGVMPIQRLRLALEAAYATGNAPHTARNEAWDELYPTTHKWLGLMDIIGVRSNIASLVAHGQLVLGDFKLMLDGHVFWRDQPAAGQHSYAGTEVDANVIYTIGRGMTVRLLGATFLPGGQHYPAASPGRANDAYYVETQYTFTL